METPSSFPAPDGAARSALEFPAVANASAAPADAGKGSAVARGARRRRRQAALVVGIALASAAVGVVVGTKLKSPADAASARAAPVASQITVPVEMRKLEATLPVAAEIRYVEPMSVRLAGAVGSSAGDSQVVTRIPDPEQELVEGGTFLEVSGRPVFALTGELPMYRQLVPGSKGPDVTQLETALNTLGFSPGVVDDLYDQGTETALDYFYASRGYVSEGASAAQRKELTDARKAVTDAQDNVRKAKNELATGTTTVTASEKLQAQQTVTRAQAALPEAQAAAQRNNDEAARAVAAATGLRNNAKADYAAQKVINDTAALPSSINVNTGVAYTAAELAELQQVLLSKDKAVIETEQALATAISAQTSAATAGQTAVSEAQGALTLAQTQLAELGKPKDTTALRDAITAAEAQVGAAQEVLNTLEAAIGTIVPAGEIVFLPRLPTSITVQNAQLGFAPPTDQLAQVSSVETQIVGRISKVDGDLIEVGTTVEVIIRDAGIETTGTITEVRAPTADPNDPSSSAGSSDRLEVVVEADDQGRLAEFVWATVKINITISATDSEVLAVPVAAISVGPDGTSRIEVVREAARGSRPGRTELVEVVVGLAAQGYAEITPLGDASVVPDDRVVVGTDTGTRRSRTRATVTTDAESTDSGSETPNTAESDTAAPSVGTG